MQTFRFVILLKNLNLKSVKVCVNTRKNFLNEFKLELSELFIQKDFLLKYVINDNI